MRKLFVLSILLACVACSPTISSTDNNIINPLEKEIKQVYIKDKPTIIVTDNDFTLSSNGTICIEYRNNESDNIALKKENIYLNNNIATINYNNYVCSFDITNNTTSDTVISIEILSYPNITNFLDDFIAYDFLGYMQVTYSNNESKTIGIEQEMLSTINKHDSEVQKITVSYQGQKDYFYLKLVPAFKDVFTIKQIPIIDTVIENKAIYKNLGVISYNGGLINISEDMIKDFDLNNKEVQLASIEYLENKVYFPIKVK